MNTNANAVSYATVIARNFAGAWVYMSCHFTNAATLTAADALNAYRSFRSHQYAEFAIVSGTIEEYLLDEVAELHDVELAGDDARIPAGRSEDCPKCGGLGRIPEFHHIAGGVCFRCNGARKALSI